MLDTSSSYLLRKQVSNLQFTFDGVVEIYVNFRSLSSETLRVTVYFTVIVVSLVIS